MHFIISSSSLLVISVFIITTIAVSVVLAQNSSSLENSTTITSNNNNISTTFVSASPTSTTTVPLQTTAAAASSPAVPSPASTSPLPTTNTTILIFPGNTASASPQTTTIPPGFESSKITYFEVIYLTSESKTLIDALISGNLANLRESLRLVLKTAIREAISSRSAVQNIIRSSITPSSLSAIQSLTEPDVNQIIPVIFSQHYGDDPNSWGSSNSNTNTNNGAATTTTVTGSASNTLSYYSVTFYIGSVWSETPYDDRSLQSAKILREYLNPEQVASLFGASLFGQKFLDLYGQNFPRIENEGLTLNQRCYDCEVVDPKAKTIVAIVSGVVGGVAIVAVIIILVTENFSSPSSLSRNDGSGYHQGNNKDPFKLSPLEQELQETNHVLLDSPKSFGLLEEGTSHSSRPNNSTNLRTFLNSSEAEYSRSNFGEKKLNSYRNTARIQDPKRFESTAAMYHYDEKFRPSWPSHHQQHQKPKNPITSINLSRFKKPNEFGDRDENGNERGNNNNGNSSSARQRWQNEEDL